jgi:hypothetical protein
VHAVGEVHQSLRSLDERGEQVRGDDVDRQDVGAGVDARVIDERRSLGAAGVDDHVVALVDQDSAGAWPSPPAEPVMEIRAA